MLNYSAQDETESRVGERWCDKDKRIHFFKPKLAKRCLQSSTAGKEFSELSNGQSVDLLKLQVAHRGLPWHTRKCCVVNLFETKKKPKDTR